MMSASAMITAYLTLHSGAGCFIATAKHVMTILLHRDEAFLLDDLLALGPRNELDVLCRRPLRFAVGVHVKRPGDGVVPLRAFSSLATTPLTVTALTLLFR